MSPKMPPKRKAAAPKMPPVPLAPEEFPTIPRVPEGLPSPDARIVAMLADPEKHGGVLTTAKAIVNRLLELKLASKCALAPSQLGVHPNNRSSYGVNEESVHRLGRDIMDMGFSLEEITNNNPWCVAEDPVDNYIRLKNEEMTEHSDLLAKVTGPILAGTLTNGHVTLLLRCILDSVPCEYEKVSINGKMSLPHVTEQSQEMGRAALHGWTWTMIHHEVRHIYGTGLFDFLSTAKNINIARKETEVQVLLKATRLACKYKNETGNIPWDEVHKNITQSKPDCSDYAHSLIRFVQEYSGGDSGHFVTDFAKFHSKYVPGERVIGGTFFEQLCNLRIQNDEKAEVKTPLLIYALLKCMSACPQHAVQSRECQYISKADIDKLIKTKAKECIEAEMLLRQSREIILNATVSVPELARVKLFGRLDVNVARILLGKQKESVHKLNNINEAGFVFFEEAESYTQSESNPWAAHSPKAEKPKPAASSSSSSNSSGLQSYSCTGQHLAAPAATTNSAALGFVVGATVLPNKSKTFVDTMVITHIGEEVTLKKVDGTEEKKSIADLAALCNVVKEECIPYGADNWAMEHALYTRTAVKGMIASALFCLTKSVGATKPELRLVAKPFKAVVSMQKYSKGDLCLLPETLSASHGKATEASGSIVETSFSLNEPGCVFFLAAPSMSLDESKKSLVAPFWLVQRTSDATRANMEITKMSMNTKIDYQGKAKAVQVPPVQCTFEVLRNSKTIGDGDELLVLAPSVGSQQKETKRQRKS